MPRAMTKESQTDHFNNKVSQPLRDKLLELANKVQEDFISDCGSESYGCRNIDAIYGYHISGFIPSQLGGYQVNELYRYDVDPSYHFTKAQSEAMQEYEAYLYECFARDYEDEIKEAKIALPENWSYSDIEHNDKLRRLFEDYESEWYEPALLRFEVWVSDSKDDSRLGNSSVEPTNIYMRLSLNYKDQPYYRSNYDETLFEFNIPIEEFMTNPVEHYIKIMNDKFKEVE